MITDDQSETTRIMVAISRGEGMPLQRSIPHHIGRHTIIEEIGAGGAGIVYSAFDPQLNRKVAVKLIRPDRQSATARRRLVREAQAMAGLSHVNVVAIHDTGLFEDSVYVVMDFIEGSTLQRWLTDNRPPWREVVGVFLQAGQGLAAAHNANLVHRDFKPDNVLVGTNGVVKVTDFGLVRSANDLLVEDLEAASEDLITDGAGIEVRLTSPGVLLGTPHYMAPEQHHGRAATAASDQYSFCVALYEGLCGVYPFPLDESGGGLAGKLAGNIRPFPGSTSGASIPSRLKAAVLRGLATDPRERWPSMADLLQELHAISRHDPIRVRRGITFVIGVLALGAAAWLLYALDQRQIETACVNEGAEVLADWGDDAKRAVEGSFLATGKPFAASTFAKTVPWLDRWTISWSQATADACRAHKLHHDWDSELYELSKDCLSEARGNFSALVDELTRGGDNALMLAVDTAAQLAPVEKCVKVDRLRRRPLMAAEQRSSILAVRAQLARAQALGTAGDYKAGLAAAETALSAAKVTRWPDIIAKAYLRVGHAAADVGESIKAEENYLRALATAKSERVVDIALAAATQLVYVVGYEQGRTAEAKVWAEAAQLQLAMFMDEDSLEWAHLYNTLGIVQYATESYEDAARSLTDAHRIYAAILGEDHPDAATTLSNLGNVYQAMGAHEDALKIHERALAARRALLGEEHPNVAISITNLANSYEGLKAHDEALRLHKVALALLERSLGGDHSSVAHSLNGTAIVYEGIGAYEEAVPLFMRSMEIFKHQQGKDHPMVALVAANLGGAYLESGQPGQAIGPLEHALAIREANQVSEGQLAKTRFFLARALLEAKVDVPRARLLAESAREICSRDAKLTDLLNDVVTWMAAHQPDQQPR